MPNRFHDTLDAIRLEGRESKDVITTIRNHIPGLIDAIVGSPLDCGVKRFRSFTLQKREPGKTGENVRSTWLLVTRATLENGDDVVSFHEHESWELTYCEFAYCVESGGVVWKPDDKRQTRVKGKTFIDSVVGNSE